MGWLRDLVTRARPRTAAEPARHEQSVDQLISIMRGEMDASGIRRTLSQEEAPQFLDGWAYASIETIAAALMSARRRVEVREGDGWVADDRHPLAVLLDQVNPLMTGPELTYWTTVETLMVGRSFVLKVRNGLGEVAELWPLVGRVTPVIDAERGLVAWREERITNGVARTLRHDVRDVVYYRLPRTGDLWGGYGRLQAAGAPLRLGLQIDEAAWAAFKRGVFPSLLAYIDEPDAEKRSRIADELRERYAGARESGGLIALHQTFDASGQKRRRIELEEIRPNTPRSMAIEAGHEDVRDRILAIIRTPLALLGLSKDVNRASAVALEYIFARWSVTPLLVMREARENQDLASEWDDTRIRYESLVPADREIDLRQQEVDLSTGVRTINEVRRERGLEPVPWGETPWLPQGLLPVGGPRPAGAEQEGGAALSRAPFRAIEERLAERAARGPEGI